MSNFKQASAPLELRETVPLQSSIPLPPPSYEASLRDRVVGQPSPYAPQMVAAAPYGYAQLPPQPLYTAGAYYRPPAQAYAAPPPMTGYPMVHGVTYSPTPFRTPPPMTQGQTAVLQRPAYPIQTQYPGIPTPAVPQFQPGQTVVIQGGFNAGARFDRMTPASVPPPPPGVAPTAAQLAAMSGANVVMGQQKGSFWGGGAGGGTVFGW